MARPLRLELAGALYHVTSRGDGGEDIFLNDEDRHLGVHYTTVSRLVRAYEAQFRRHSRMA